MIVRCIAVYGKDLPSDCIVRASDFNNTYKFALQLNKCYVVYAMIISSCYIWYFIADENFTYYPHWHPSPLFKVEEGKLSKYWIYGFEKGENKETTRTIFAYPEWTNNPYYFDALTDGDEEEVRVFKQYKEKMDLEFPNPSVIKKAINLDNRWLMCPICIDAWESLSTEGMIKCPKCETVLHNPRYQV